MGGHKHSPRHGAVEPAALPSRRPSGRAPRPLRPRRHTAAAADRPRPGQTRAALRVQNKCTPPHDTPSLTPHQGGVQSRPPSSLRGHLHVDVFNSKLKTFYVVCRLVNTIMCQVCVLCVQSIGTSTSKQRARFHSFKTTVRSVEEFLCAQAHGVSPTTGLACTLLFEVFFTDPCEGLGFLLLVPRSRVNMP